MTLMSRSRQPFVPANVYSGVNEDESDALFAPIARRKDKSIHASYSMGLRMAFIVDNAINS